jgi:hypothetical protein
VEATRRELGAASSRSAIAMAPIEGVAETAVVPQFMVCLGMRKVINAAACSALRPAVRASGPARPRGARAPRWPKSSRAPPALPWRPL